MRETVDIDIFDQIETADVICIPTNCSLEDGYNPMGALAGAAARRWPDVPFIYGSLLRVLPNVPCILGFISKDDPTVFSSAIDESLDWDPEMHTILVAFPTMHLITLPADLDLVRRSAELLVEMADLNAWEEICMGRPGCGVGGLRYEDQVKPMLEQIFDDRFVVMHK